MGTVLTVFSGRPTPRRAVAWRNADEGRKPYASACAAAAKNALRRRKEEMHLKICVSEASLCASKTLKLAEQTCDLRPLVNPGPPEYAEKKRRA